MTISVGVLGAGRHSKQNHGPALARLANEELDDVALSAVCDLDGEKARSYASSFGFDATYTDYERMLRNEELDALLAITPPSRTRELAGDLLSYHIPLLIEKPPGRTIAEARELREIADRTGTPHMVSFNRRFNPAVRRAREWVAEHEPSPSFGRSTLYRVGRLEEYFVIETGIHAVDTLASFFGSPRAVSARRWQSRANGGQTIDGRVTFDGDTSVQLALCPDAGRRAECYELIGREFSIDIDVIEGSIDVAEGGESVYAWQLSSDAPTFERNGTLGEMKAFLRAVAGDRAFSPTLQDGEDALRTVAALDMAVITGSAD